MSLITIILIGVVVAIMVKTGSIGKALGFLLKYAFYPGLFGILFLFLGMFVGLPLPAFFVGLILGWVKVVRDAKNKLK